MTNCADCGRLTGRGEPPLPPRKKVYAKGYLAYYLLPRPLPREFVLLHIVGVHVGVVGGAVVHRLCDIIAGGAVVHIAVVVGIAQVAVFDLGAVVHFLGRDGGEGGDVGLSVNH